MLKRGDTTQVPIRPQTTSVPVRPVADTGSLQSDTADRAVKVVIPTPLVSPEMRDAIDAIKPQSDERPVDAAIRVLVDGDLMDDTSGGILQEYAEAWEILYKDKDLTIDKLLDALCSNFQATKIHGADFFTGIRSLAHLDSTVHSEIAARLLLGQPGNGESRAEVELFQEAYPESMITIETLDKILGKIQELTYGEIYNESQMGGALKYVCDLKREKQKQAEISHNGEGTGEGTWIEPVSKTDRVQLQKPGHESGPIHVNRPETTKITSRVRPTPILKKNPSTEDKIQFLQGISNAEEITPSDAEKLFGSETGERDNIFREFYVAFQTNKDQRKDAIGRLIEFYRIVDNKLSHIPTLIILLALADKPDIPNASILQAFGDVINSDIIDTGTRIESENEERLRKMMEEKK